MTIGICSERSPIYLFLKAHNSPDQLGKDEDFWLQMVANLHTQSLELRYDLQALTEFYAALNYLLPNFSETHYPNTKAVMQKNLDLIRSYLIQDRHSDELMSIIFADAFLLHLTKETALFKSETFKKLAESLVAHAGERLDSITLHNIFSIYPEKVINYLQSHTSVIESLDPVFMSILINHKNSAPLLEKMIPLQTVYQNEVYMVDSIRSLKNQGYSVQNMKTCIDQIKADDMRCKFMQAFINDYGHAICKPIFMPTVHELLATPGLTKELMLTFISWVNPDDYEQLPWDALSIKKIDAIKIEYPLLKELTDDALAARKAKQPFATYRADKKAAEEAKIKAEQCAKQTQLLEQQKANEAREAAKQLALQQQKNKQKQLKIEEEEQRQAYLLEKKQEAAAQSARDKAATPVGKIQRITSPETTPAQSSASDRPESGYASKPITTPELPTADNDESLEMQLERVKKVVPALIASLHHRNAETERHYHAAATEIARLSQELEQRPVMPIFFPVAVPMPVPVVMVPLVPVEYHPTIFAERRRRQRHRKPCPEAHSTHKADEPTHDEKQSTLPGLGANGNTSN